MFKIKNFLFLQETNRKKNCICEWFFSVLLPSHRAGSAPKFGFLDRLCFYLRYALVLSCRGGLELRGSVNALLGEFKFNHRRPPWRFIWDAGWIGTGTSIESVSFDSQGQAPPFWKKKINERTYNHTPDEFQSRREIAHAKCIFLRCTNGKVRWRVFPLLIISLYKYGD